MKSGSHRYDMNRTRPKHGHKCSKYYDDGYAIGLQ